MKNYGDLFEDKKILITGGTGSFGKMCTTELLKHNPKKIIIFSRDEQKQTDMANEFEDDRLEFIIGDVRDFDRVNDALNGVDICYHAAAMKIIPTVEKHIMEGIKTNIIGGFNVLRACLNHKVEKCIAISTDKACKPVNMYGSTKMLQEGLFLQHYNCVRYGNILGSRGSIVPYIKERMEMGRYIPLTHRKMTRFVLTLNDAIELVFAATALEQYGNVLVHKSPACRIIDLMEVMTEGKDVEIREVGIRPGEKIHECLIHEEELFRTEEMGNFYKIGRKRLKEPLLESEFTSNTTRMLTKNEIKALLKKEGYL